MKAEEKEGPRWDKRSAATEAVEGTKRKSSTSKAEFASLRPLRVPTPIVGSSFGS